MKIENLEFENENLSRLFKTGQKILLAASASFVLSSFSPSHENIELRPNPEVTSIADEVEDAFATEVDLADINRLNLILCDNECNDEIFDATTTKLTEAGVEFMVAKPEDEDLLSRASSTVITLSSTVYRSESAVVLGQYDNNKQSNSDALALAMEAGLQSKDVAIDGIRLGITQIEHEEGITHRVPTGTELKIAPSSSFVTVALGTQMDPNQKEMISEGIFDGILRAAVDIKENEHADYLYRITGYDTIDAMAIKMDVPSELLKEMNPNLEKDLIQKDDVVRHPDIIQQEAFSKNSHFRINPHLKSL